jgi:hypothetical protein
MTKNMKKVCHLDSNCLIWSSSLYVQTSRFLETFVRNSRHKPEGMRWSFKEKVLAVCPETWPKVLYLSPVSISSTFQMNLTDHSKQCSL